MTELGKQVWKKMEEMGCTPEDFHLNYGKYENIIECTKQVLTTSAVSSMFCDYCKKRKRFKGDGTIEQLCTC